MENKRRAWGAALRMLSLRREAHRTLDPSSIYAPRPDVHELHMEAEVPPVSARNQRRRSQKILGGAEVRQSAGMGPENRRSPANTRLAQANKREAWQTWQSKSHHVPSRIVDSSIAQRFFVFGPEPVMIALDQSGSLDIRYLRSIIFLYGQITTLMIHEIRSQLDIWLFAWGG